MKGIGFCLFKLSIKKYDYLIAADGDRLRCVISIVGGMPWYVFRSVGRTNKKRRLASTRDLKSWWGCIFCLCQTEVVYIESGHMWRLNPARQSHKPCPHYEPPVWQTSHWTCQNVQVSGQPGGKNTSFFMQLTYLYDGMRLCHAQVISINMGIATILSQHTPLNGLWDVYIYRKYSALWLFSTASLW